MRLSVKITLNGAEKTEARSEKAGEESKKGNKMYINPNFKTKKELKNAIKNNKSVHIFSPGPFPAPTNGVTSIEGPHYPQPHTWYARVEIKDGLVIKVIS